MTRHLVLALAFVLAAACGAQSSPSPAPAPAKPSPAPGGAGGAALVVQLAHTGAIRALALSPDGASLATGGEDGSVMVWDLATRQLRARLIGHQTEVRQVVWSADGRWLVTAATDVRIWDTATGAQRAAIGGRGKWISSFAIDPGGSALATWHRDRGLELWDVPSGQRRRVLEAGPSWIQRLAFFPAQPAWLAVSESSGPVTVWDTATGKKVARLANAAGPFALSPNGDTLAYAATDRAVVLWDTAAAKPRARLTGHTAALSDLGFSHDGKLLVSTENGPEIRLWDPAAATLRRAITTKRLSHYAPLFAADDTVFVVTGSLDQHGTWEHAAYDPASGAELSRFGDRVVLGEWGAPGAPFVAAPYVGDALRLFDPATGTRLGEINWTADELDHAWGNVSFGAGTIWDARSNALWDVDGAKPRATLATRGGRPHWNEARRLFAVQRIDGKDEHIDLSDATTGQPTGSFRWKEAELFPESPDNYQYRASPRRELAFSPDGAFLATMTPTGVDLRDAATGAVQRTLQAGDAVTAMSFSADGRALATLDWTQKRGHGVTVWDTGTGAARQTVWLTRADAYAHELALAPSGDWVAVAGKRVRLYDVKRGKLRADLELGGDGVAHVAIDPTGSRIAAWSDDHEGWVAWYDAATGKRLGLTETSYVQAVAFSPDGTTLAFAGRTGVAAWDVVAASPRYDAPFDGRRLNEVSLAWIGDGVFVVSGPEARFVRLADGAELTFLVVSSGQALGVLCWTTAGDYAGDAVGLARVRFRRGGLAGPAELVDAAAVPDRQRADLLTGFLSGR